MDAVYTAKTNILVRQYFNVNEKLCAHKPDADIVKDLEFIKKKIDLQPGTAYKFRVAAYNACGRGPWSEVSLFFNYSPTLL